MPDNGHASSNNKSSNGSKSSKNNSNNDHASSEPNSWISVIPDFFYELIGRIIPGSTFLLGLIYTIDQTFFCDVLLKQKTGGSSIELPYIVIFFVFLGLSYSAGFFLTPLGDKLGKLFYVRQYEKKFKFQPYEEYNKRLWIDTFNNKIEFPSNRKLSYEEVEWLFQCQHNLTKKENHRLSRSLSKSAADVQLCINTSAAFFIIAIVSLFKFPCYRIFEFESLCVCIPLHVVVALIFGLGFLCAAYYRNDRFLSRQFSFFWEAQKEKDKKDSEKK